jgi:hypothetical protein
MSLARTVDEIQAAIIADIAADPDLIYVDSTNTPHNITNNTSKRAKWRLTTWITAAAIAIQEQLIDIFQASNEAAIAAAIPETASWLAKMVSQFQYSATSPQIVQLPASLIPAYPTIDPSLQIITRRSVTTTANNRVLIKVAKSEPPQALVTAELNALQDYITTIGVPGIEYIASSTAADELYVKANIYYQGQYSAIILQSVTDALTGYLAALSSVVSFNGVVKISDLENTIRNVAGVNDVVLVDVRARKDATPLSAADYLVQGQTVLSRIWPTVAGYIVQETTSGNTFADTLNLISQ